jgi:hypothetical protein
VHGCPIAFYSDKHSVFRVAKKEAKGRVEWVNRTLQDRLVKKLRMAKISDIAAANPFLPGFIERFNHREAKQLSPPDPFAVLARHLGLIASGSATGPMTR